MVCDTWLCRPQVFAHNDADHLEAVLRASIAEGQPRTRRPWKKVLVVVEGIYSMEGEIVDLAAIVAVAKKYKVRRSPHSALMRRWRSDRASSFLLRLLWAPALRVRTCAGVPVPG